MDDTEEWVSVVVGPGGDSEYTASLDRFGFVLVGCSNDIGHSTMRLHFYLADASIRTFMSGKRT